MMRLLRNAARHYSARAGVDQSAGGYFSGRSAPPADRANLARHAEGRRNLFSVYAGGLWVRTSLDPGMQGYAKTALRERLVRYDRGRGWSGPIETIRRRHRIGRNALRLQISALAYRTGGSRSCSPRGQRRADRLCRWKDRQLASMGRNDASQRQAGQRIRRLKPGDVIAVKPEGGGWVVAQYSRNFGRHGRAKPAYRASAGDAGRV